MQSGKRYRIFITGSGLAVSAQEYLLKQNCISESGHPSDTPDNIAAKLEAFKPDGLIVRQGRISGTVMDAASELRVICKHGVGTDNIDIDAASAFARRVPEAFPAHAVGGDRADSGYDNASALQRSAFRLGAVHCGYFSSKWS